MNKIIILLGLLFISLSACKKDNNTEVCYECRDLNGNTLNSYCGTSEDDAFNKAKGGTINGTVISTKTQFLQYCPKK